MGIVDYLIARIDNGIANPSWKVVRLQLGYIKKDHEKVIDSKHMAQTTS